MITFLHGDGVPGCLQTRQLLATFLRIFSAIEWEHQVCSNILRISVFVACEWRWIRFVSALDRPFTVSNVTDSNLGFGLSPMRSTWAHLVRPSSWIYIGSAHGGMYWKLKNIRTESDFMKSRMENCLASSPIMSWAPSLVRSIGNATGFSLRSWITMVQKHTIG